MKLAEKAQEFRQLIVKKVSEKLTSIVENSDAILKELSDLQSFNERVGFARKKFKELGEGSSRTIFLLSDSLVLKVAHNDKGIQQNLAEMKPSMQRSCTNNVLFADTDGKWLVVRFTDGISEERFGQLVGIPFKQFMKAIYWKMNNEIHSDQPRDYDKIVQHPLYKCLLQLIVDNDLQVGDVAKASSFGEVDGKVLLRDFGLTKEIWRDFYDDGSDNNSTSTI